MSWDQKQTSVQLFYFIIQSDWALLCCDVCYHMQHESDKTRNVSATKRAVMSSSSRPGSSGELSENRLSRLFSSGGAQKIQPGQETKPSTRLGRDDTMRSFDLLTIGGGSGKRKWVTRRRLCVVWKTLFIPSAKKMGRKIKIFTVHFLCFRRGEKIIFSPTFMCIEICSCYKVVYVELVTTTLFNINSIWSNTLKTLLIVY